MLLGVNPVDTFRAALKALPEGGLARIEEKTGIDASRLSGYRSGRKTDVRISTFAAIAEAMGRSADELLGLTPRAVAGTVADFREAEALNLKLQKQLEAQRKVLERIYADLGRVLGHE